MVPAAAGLGGARGVASKCLCIEPSLLVAETPDAKIKESVPRTLEVVSIVSLVQQSASAGEAADTENRGTALGHRDKLYEEGQTFMIHTHVCNDETHVADQ